MSDRERIELLEAIIRELVDANETVDGAIGLIRVREGHVAATVLREVLSA